MSGSRAAFVDRDGTINELVNDPVSGQPESPLQARDVALIPGAAHALQRLQGAGWLLVGISNQPTVAKGTTTMTQLTAVHSSVLELLAAEAVTFDGFRVCLHHPDGVIDGLTGDCPCRKPKPGMLIDAARELDIDLSSSWMIGDTDTDVLAGVAAGCRTVLVAHQPSAHKRKGVVSADATATDLRQAAELILHLERVD